MILMEWQQKFRTVEDCQTFLVQQRWPEGFVCPGCGHRAAWIIHRQDRHDIDRYECQACRQQTSATAGTIFHRSKIPLAIWFQALGLIGKAEWMQSSYRLGQILGIPTGSAQLLRKKIQRGMADERIREQLYQIQQWMAQKAPSAAVPLPRCYSLIIRGWPLRDQPRRGKRKKIVSIQRMRTVRAWHIGFEWTSRRVLFALQCAYRQKGYYTGAQWRRAKKKPAVPTIRKMFGSWSQAWQAAGCAAPSRIHVSTVIADLQRIGHYLSQDQWQQEGRRPNVKTIGKLFGSYRAAWQAAGIPPMTRTQQAHGAIQEEIRATLRNTGRYYTIKEWAQAGRQPGVAQICYYFGSWRAAWKAAGIPKRPPRS